MPSRRRPAASLTQPVHTQKPHQTGYVVGRTIWLSGYYDFTGDHAGVQCQAFECMSPVPLASSYQANIVKP